MASVIEWAIVNMVICHSSGRIRVLNRNSPSDEQDVIQPLGDDVIEAGADVLGDHVENPVG